MLSLVFVLAMEYYTRLMSSVSKQAAFNFHSLCKNQGFACLAFADDLLVFCKGHKASVQIVMGSFLITLESRLIKAGVAVIFGDFV